MSEFPECLLIVIAEVDAAIEGEWNRWYDTVHLPDALRCPGVRRGRQNGTDGAADLHDDLRARQPGRHRYPGVPRHAWLVPVRAACPLAHAGDRAGPGAIGQLAAPAHSRRLRWRPRPDS